MIDRAGLLGLFSPLRLAFLASLLLSAVAISGEPVVSRDATLYVDVAQVFLDDGLDGALAIFDWPWFSVSLGSHTG